MSNSVPETSLSADIFRYIRYQLRGRRGLIAAAVTLGIPALWLSWPWLVIAGVAPILIALAPCAIMCAVGLCTMKSCSSANAGEAGSCPKSQASDEKVASVTASKLADETAVPIPLAVSSQANATLAEVESKVETETAEESGGSLNQEKEKFQ